MCVYQIRVVCERPGSFVWLLAPSAPPRVNIFVVATSAQLHLSAPFVYSSFFPLPADNKQCCCTGRLNCGLNTCPARHSAWGVQIEPIDVRQLLTGLILPSSGDCPRRYKRTHLYFGFGGGRGHLVLLLGLQDLLHEATCSSSSRGNEENIKNPFQT